MELRKGYKRTEVGDIPEEWSDSRFDEVFRRLNSRPHQIQTSEYQRIGSVPVVDQGQTTIVGYTDRIEYRFKCPDDGVIVFGDHTCIVKFVDFDFAVGADGTQLIVAKAGECTRFHAFALEHRGVASTGYNRHFKFLRERPFVRPPLPEQHAIAAVLSDIDALLNGLDRLIAKKRDLKQATMQELLTGQTRLPGFRGEWDVKRLGEVLTICHGKSQRGIETTQGPFPILASGGQIGTASRPLYNKPSVLIGRKGTINRPQYMDTPFWTVDTLFYSQILGNNSALYIYYLFCTIDWMQFNEASGVPSLNARTIENVEATIPEPSEQTAIAAVLSDMDAEIAAVEARRNKTHALKQAMMQELLTGKTRLVPPGEPSV
jgi:type I restriction enzyme S subunit